MCRTPQSRATPLVQNRIINFARSRARARALSLNSRFSSSSMRATRGLYIYTKQTFLPLSRGCGLAPRFRESRSYVRRSNSSIRFTYERAAHQRSARSSPRRFKLPPFSRCACYVPAEKPVTASRASFSRRASAQITAFGERERERVRVFSAIYANGRYSIAGWRFSRGARPHERVKSNTVVVPRV